MQRERKLGKGLGQLLSGGLNKATGSVASNVGQGLPTSPASQRDAGETDRRVRRIPIAKIAANPWQPRIEFPAQELEELIASIREQGLLQPISVRERTGGYQLVAGERRLRACRELGWNEIDALVIEATDQQMLEWAIIENLQRASLNPIETAQSFRRLIAEFSLTQDEAARRLGQSRVHITNTLRLLDLPAEILGHVSRGTIAPGAARALLGLSDLTKQKALAERIVKEQLSVRHVEDLVRDHKKSTSRPRAGEADGVQNANRDAAARELEQVLKTKVRIVGSASRGSVRIEYHSERQLRDLFDRLVRAPEARGSAAAHET